VFVEAAINEVFDDVADKHPGYVHEKLVNSLKAKFKPNRLMENAGNPYFPDHCLGAGCADWAVSTTTTFTKEFFSRLGVIPNYQRSHDFPAP